MGWELYIDCPLLNFIFCLICDTIIHHGSILNEFYALYHYIIGLYWALFSGSESCIIGEHWALFFAPNHTSCIGEHPCRFIFRPKSYIMHRRASSFIFRPKSYIMHRGALSFIFCSISYIIGVWPLSSCRIFWRSCGKLLQQNDKTCQWRTSSFFVTCDIINESNVSLLLFPRLQWNKEDARIGCLYSSASGGERWSLFIFLEIVPCQTWAAAAAAAATAAAAAGAATAGQQQGKGSANRGRSRGSRSSSNNSSKGSRSSSSRGSRSSSSSSNNNNNNNNNRNSSVSRGRKALLRPATAANSILKELFIQRVAIVFGRETYANPAKGDSRPARQAIQTSSGRRSRPAPDPPSDGRPFRLNRLQTARAHVLFYRAADGGHERRDTRRGDQQLQTSAARHCGKYQLLLVLSEECHDW